MRREGEEEESERERERKMERRNRKKFSPAHIHSIPLEVPSANLFDRIVLYFLDR
jgi:hypothetical protein